MTEGDSRAEDDAIDETWKKRSAVFGEVAELYDRFRPAYPDDPFDDIVQWGGLEAGHRVIEVGAGTGRATLALAARGLEVFAVEPSAEMLALLRANTADFEAVTSRLGRFEDWDPSAADPFDALVSAQAWHWVDQRVGPTKAHAALRPHGTVAMLWNRPAPDDSDLRRALDEVYERIAPDLADSSMLVQNAIRLIPDRNDGLPIIGELDERFTDVEVREYSWTATYTTEGYLGLMQTHSDHVVLDEEVRGRILDETAALIDSNGGSVPFEYCTDLILARRRA